MKIKELIQETVKTQEYEISCVQKRIAALKLLSERINDFDISEGSISFGAETIDFDCLNRESVTAILSKIPAGRWDKSVNSYGTINYVTQKEFLDGYKLRMYGAEPPPSCKLIKEEVDVPAHKETRFRLECAPVAAIDKPALSTI